MDKEKNLSPVDLTEVSLQEQPADEHIPVAIIDDEPLCDDDESYTPNSSRIRTHLEKSGITEQERYKKKLSLLQWIADFFFHYKHECIIGMIIIAIGALLYISNIEKSYDYVITIYTYDAEISSDQLDCIADIFRGYGEDIDGDGEVTIDLHHYHPYTGWFVPKYTASQRLYDDIFGNRTSILILTDEQCRDNIIERFSDYHFESLQGKDKWVSLNGTAFCSMTNGEPLPVELGLMMFKPGHYAKDTDDVQKRHSEAKQMLEHISEDIPELFSE